MNISNLIQFKNEDSTKISFVAHEQSFPLSTTDL